MFHSLPATTPQTSSWPAQWREVHTSSASCSTRWHQSAARHAWRASMKATETRGRIYNFIWRYSEAKLMSFISLYLHLTSFTSFYKLNTQTITAPLTTSKWCSYIYQMAWLSFTCEDEIVNFTQRPFCRVRLHYKEKRLLASHFRQTRNIGLQFCLYLFHCRCQ